MTTKNTIALAELAEKGADADLLRDMIQFVAQRMMEMDVESLCAAFYGERSPERLNSRNGSPSLSLVTGSLIAGLSRTTSTTSSTAPIRCSSSRQAVRFAKC